MGSNFHKAMPPLMITILFGIKNPYKKRDKIKMQFISRLGVIHHKSVHSFVDLQ
jgi:hypothetical protein